MRLIFWLAAIAAVWWWLDKQKPRARRPGAAGLATSGLVAVLETGGRAIDGVIDLLEGRQIDPVGLGTTVAGGIVNPSAAKPMPAVQVSHGQPYRWAVRSYMPPPSPAVAEVRPTVGANYHVLVTP